MQAMFMMAGETFCMAAYLIHKCITSRKSKGEAGDGGELPMNPLILFPVSIWMGWILGKIKHGCTSILSVLGVIHGSCGDSPGVHGTSLFTGWRHISNAKRWD